MTMPDGMNPYAPPADGGAREGDPGSYVWQELGDAVFYKDGSRLPDRCVVCNEPACGRRLHKELFWHDPGLYALLLAGPVVYLLGSLLSGKRARVPLPICARHLRRRRLAMVLGFGGALWGLALTILAAIYEPIVIIFGLLMLIGLPITGFLLARLWTVTRIDERLVRLRCGPAFVASLPQVSAELVSVAMYPPYADPHRTFGASPSGFVVPGQWGFGG